jgi:hypothetical protein
MKKIIFTYCLMVACIGAFAQTNKSVLAGKTHRIPHLAKQGNATQLLVNDQPYLILGGEPFPGNW